MKIKEIFKNLFATAEMDGIVFYSKSAFNEYLERKEKDRLLAKGYHEYCFRGYGYDEYSKATNILERSDIFNYRTEGHELSEWKIYYVAKNAVIVYK